MRGVLHVHSVFSDGEETLEGVVQAFRDAGMDFVAMSDHAEVFDEQRMERYVARCESLTSAHFLVIPGLEFARKGGSIHILGYGITKRVRASSMDQLVDGIHDAGGVAVLAHPPVGSINMIDSVKRTLDGVEVWNGRYDGVVTPRARSFQLLRRVRMSNSKAAAYGGVDFHKLSQAHKLVYVEVETGRFGRPEVIDALREGRFSLHGGKMTIPSSGNLSFAQEFWIALKQPFCRPRAA
jgi:predicted metal-dependent phosphoesterase TrpH